MDDQNKDNTKIQDLEIDDFISDEEEFEQELAAMEIDLKSDADQKMINKKRSADDAIEQKDDNRTVAALDEKIRQYKEKYKEKEAQPTPSGVSMVGRIFAELLAGILVGGGIGFGIDYFLGTMPVFFTLSLILGVAGSGLNIYKVSQRW